MREGEIVLTNLQQADGSYKLRPVLVLKQLPGYNDFLVCGISTQLHQLIKDFDELLDEKDRHFMSTGLRQSSIIRLGFLATIPSGKIPGTIGSIDPELHKSLIGRLANYLTR